MTEESISMTQEVEKKILDVMSENPKGISNKILLESLSSVDKKQLVICLNNLLSQHKVELLQRDNQPFYKLKCNTAQQYKGSDIEEKVVFEAVERAGNNGIMAKDLKFKCHLPLPQINKILKAMEGKKMIKCVTLSSRKKVFMLYNLEPSQKLTGGAFYSGQEFESEFVNVLGDQCYRYLVQAKATADKLSDPRAQRNTSYKSSRDICDYINCLKISKVNLSCKDIETILDSLIYDDKIEKCVRICKTNSVKESGMENLYRVSNPLAGSQGLMMMPCGICTVYQDCHVGGEVSPATCIYMKQWLDF